MVAQDWCVHGGGEEEEEESGRWRRCRNQTDLPSQHKGLGLLIDRELDGDLAVCDQKDARPPAARTGNGGGGVSWPPSP